MSSCGVTFFAGLCVVCLLAYMQNVYSNGGVLMFNTAQQLLGETASSSSSSSGQTAKAAGSVAVWDLAVDEEWLSWMPGAVIEEDDHMMLSPHHLSLYQYLSPTAHLARFRWSKWQRASASAVAAAASIDTREMIGVAATAVSVEGWRKLSGKPRLEWIANPCVNAFGHKLGQPLPASFRHAERLLLQYIAETKEEELPDYMDLPHRRAAGQWQYQSQWR